MEKEALESISILSTYFGNEIFTIDKERTELELENSGDTNVTIARDLELDNFLQLHVYVFEKGHTIADFSVCRDQIAGAIESDEGNK